MVVGQWDAWIFLKRWGVFPEVVVITRHRRAI
jgi:hypothetical protein